MTRRKRSVRQIIAQTLTGLAIALLAQPSWAVPQEGTPDPGEGLTAFQTILYFLLAPLGLFLTIVVVGYAIHRPRERRSTSGNVLTEIK